MYAVNIYNQATLRYRGNDVVPPTCGLAYYYVVPVLHGESSKCGACVVHARCIFRSCVQARGTGGCSGAAAA